MKLYSILLIGLLAACTPPNTKSKQTNIETPNINPEQVQFIQRWSEAYNKNNLPVLAMFRARYINKTDLNELDSYLKRRDTSVKFDIAKEYINTKEELGIDTTQLTSIKWVQNTDVETCRKVDPTFWDCYNRRSDVTAFYYLSMPLFSNDGQWCLMSVNMLSKVEGQSFGGGRLYHLEKGKWEEKAFLSYWGKKPE